ncbi:MAG: acyl-CoA desaturase [Methylotenera sp.]|nr:acyl-CoA desaturase [Oligoflexia bacterium]
MIILLSALLIFSTGYLLNIFYITVFYHRALTHRSVVMSPATERFLASTGSWVTGIDPKAWACMHRLHHQYSDTPRDPHSPIHQGVFGLAMGQLRSYEKILVRLIRGDKKLSAVVSDIPFDVNYLNRKKLWFLPYLLHVGIAVAFGFAFQNAIPGIAYFLGIMSHPVQGWMVNALAHKYGYRNFDSSDHSRNNTLVALLVFGEGLQNNHHQFPGSAKFSITPKELDLGYGLCLLAERVGILQIPDRPAAALSA